MASRKQNIEKIMEGMFAIRHKVMSEAMRGNFHGKFEPHITPSQWMVLSVIMRQEKAIGVKDVARDLRITSSAATQLIDELVKKKYLARRGDIKDRRALILELSPGYKNKINMIKRAGAKRLAGLFSALSDKELEQYVAINKKIVDNIK